MVAESGGVVGRAGSRFVASPGVLTAIEGAGDGKGAGEREGPAALGEGGITAKPEGDVGVERKPSVRAGERSVAALSGRFDQLRPPTAT